MLRLPTLLVALGLSAANALASDGQPIVPVDSPAAVQIRDAIATAQSIQPVKPSDLASTAAAGQTISAPGPTDDPLNLAQYTKEERALVLHALALWKDAGSPQICLDYAVRRHVNVNNNENFSAQGDSLPPDSLIVCQYSPYRPDPALCSYLVRNFDAKISYPYSQELCEGPYAGLHTAIFYRRARQALVPEAEAVQLCKDATLQSDPVGCYKRATRDLENTSITFKNAIHLCSGYATGEHTARYYEQAVHQEHLSGDDATDLCAGAALEDPPVQCYETERGKYHLEFHKAIKNCGPKFRASMIHAPHYNPVDTNFQTPQTPMTKKEWEVRPR